MANRYWIGNAHATKQINTIAITGAGAAADTITMTMNGKDLVVTIGSGTTTGQIAASVRDAWNATSFIDGTGDTTNTSNFGGQEHGEYSEVTAVIYSTSLTTVRLIANQAGKPFTVTVAKTGTLTFTHTAATQAATGPNHWDNADNWKALAVATSGDVAIFKDSNVSVKYGLPTSGRITILQYQSYTGNIGLAEINTDNAAKPFYEYRATHVVLDDTGAADTTLTHIFGLGEGNGSPLINVRHNNTVASPNALTVSALIHNTGTPQIAGTKALNLLINNAGLAGGTVTALRGSVNLGKRDVVNVTVGFATLNIGYGANQPSNADVLVEEHVAALTINQYGGTLQIAELGLASLSLARTLNISGGVCTINDLTTSGTVTATILNATLFYNATKTITTLIIGTGGIVDLERDARALTVTTCDLFEGATLLDEFARGTYTAGIDLNRCGIDDVTIRVGNNRRLTIGAAA